MFGNARWHVVLQLGVVAEGERDAFFGELDDLGVGAAGGRPAVNIGRFCPPAIDVVVMEDADRPTGCTCIRVAEGVGFEPTRARRLTAFKAAAFNRSATPPGARHSM